MRVRVSKPEMALLGGSGVETGWCKGLTWRKPPPNTVPQPGFYGVSPSPVDGTEFGTRISPQVRILPRRPIVSYTKHRIWMFRIMGYQRSAAHLANVRKAAQLAGDARRAQKLARIAAYLENPARCQNCGDSLPYEKNRNKFCSNACAAAFNNRGRTPTAQHRAKTSLSLRSHHAKRPGQEHEPPSCLMCGSPVKARHRKYCSVTCAHAAPEQRAAFSKLMRDRVAAGTHTGWQSRQGLTPSYPEKYFIQLFEAESAPPYVRELRVGRWFIDFAFPTLKLAVEIDGRQHLLPERQDSDRKKDSELLAAGWTVVRVQWANPATDKGKASLYPQIESLLQRLGCRTTSS